VSSCGTGHDNDMLTISYDLQPDSPEKIILVALKSLATLAEGKNANHVKLKRNSQSFKAANQRVVKTEGLVK